MFHTVRKITKFNEPPMVNKKTNVMQIFFGSRTGHHSISANSGSVP